ncbi:MAG: glycoside hydrolase family 88 protein [Mariniphaga sp.]|nr:glycoside hydrolase family 88 protein [Mariniphaga sp.]
MAGISAVGNNLGSSNNQPQKSGQLFLKEISGIKDKIERVKIATLGMQRYDWEQGTVAQAFLEMGELDLAISFARGAIVRQEKGRFSVLKGNGPITDCASVGEVVLFAAEHTGDPIFRKGADEMFEVIKTTKHKTPEGIIYHTQEPNKGIWSDATYMLPPFLAAAGEYKEALKQIDGFRKYLYHENDKLYSHMWDDVKKQFNREDFWGVGNGWSAAGITRVIKMLPDSFLAEKKMLISYTKDVIDGCLKYLRDDGLFHDVVNKPDTFPEVNLSQMLCYSIYRGVAAGYLNPSYLNPTEIMRKAANDRVDKLGYVHDVCGLPHFNRSYFAPEGQAFYLLMETAAADLAKSRK